MSKEKPKNKRKTPKPEWKISRNRWILTFTVLFICVFIVFGLLYVGMTKYRILRVRFSATFLEDLPDLFGTGSSEPNGIALTHVLIAEEVPNPLSEGFEENEWYYEIIGGAFNPEFFNNNTDPSGFFGLGSDQDWKHEYYQKLYLDENIETIQVILLFMNLTSRYNFWLSQEVTLFKSTEVIIQSLDFSGNFSAIYSTGINLDINEKNFLWDSIFSLL